MPSFQQPRLLADIGGRFVRFVIETAPGRFEKPMALRCDDHPDFHAAVTAYLSRQPDLAVEHAAVAMGNPVVGDRVRMTNSSWHFSIDAMRRRLQLKTLVVVNDFTALAMSLPRLSPAERRQVGSGEARPGSVIGLVGAGSGLGVSGLVPADDGWIALGTEGGHASFAPRDESEIAILRHALRSHRHVSFERLLSGPGIELIHEALSEQAGIRSAGATGRPSARQITRRALDGADPLCTRTLDIFCAILGTAAANLAVTQGALGGIYIGGGIVPQLGEWIDRSPFRARFEDKGRFSDYCQRIPTFVITSDQATFVGLSVILAQQIRGGEALPATPLIDQIQRSLAKLTPAEKRVAEYVLDHPRSVMNDPISQISVAARVSQPTVIRFCRSLGCEGLSDFKLRLASGLAGTLPLAHAQVTGGDTMLELGVKVLGNTASAILQMREQLNREAIDRAIDLLNAAERIEFYAAGHYSVLAADAQLKFLRLGIPSVAHTDTRIQPLAAGLVRAGVVVVVISSTGRVPELVVAADKARERGAVVIAITSRLSPLARKADVSLLVDPVEDPTAQIPMVGRILYLLMVDILAVGVSMRRGSVPWLASDELPDVPQSTGVQRTRAAAGDLSDLTMHGRNAPG